MARFKKAVITEKGLALVTKVQMGSTTLKFTKIATGAGSYGDEDVGTRIELKDKKQEFSLSSISVVDNDTVKLRAVISNAGLETGYYIREIGLFAQDPDEGEILYSLAVAYDGQWDYLPAESEVSPATINLDTFSSVANASTVTIQGGTGAYASAADLEALRKLVEEHYKVIFGPETAEIENGTILFCTGEETENQFRNAGFTNLYMGDQPPDGENTIWAKPDNMITGDLTVSEEESADTVFLAKI